MSGSGRIAEATACDSKGCYSSHLLVRGDRVSFLSTEAYRQSKAKREVRDGKVYWSPSMPPSDVKLPPGYVLVHDTVGELLTKCDLYIVRWRRGGSKEASKDIIEDAHAYFEEVSGRQLGLRYGSVEIPAGPWKKIARVSFIRYQQPGVPGPSEHAYDPAVDVYDCMHPLAWRLPLPTGCVVDSHGFVWP